MPLHRISARRAVVQANRGRGFRTEHVWVAGDFEICASNTMELDRYEETHQKAGISGGGAGRVFIRQMEKLGDDMALKPWFLRNVVDFKFRTTDKPEAYVFGHLGLSDPAGSLVVAGANMAGLHPKSLAVEGSTVRYSVWPDWAGLIDITQGEGRTVDLHVGPLPPDADGDAMLRTCFLWECPGVFTHLAARPCVDVGLDPEHVRASRVFMADRLPACDPRGRFAFERKVRTVWTPDEPVPANGHWHYGDVFCGWSNGGNNEEMVGHMWFQEYLRSGRAECLHRGLAQALHIAEVDLCAHSADPYQCGGMCSHGPRHNHTAAYPSHMWFTELFFAYALTGDREFLEAGRRACDNLVFWVRDPAGFAVICADGREAGQPLINLAWAYAFLPEKRYLDAIRTIVREAFMANAARHGRLTYLKPREDFALLSMPGYGEWAAWEGLYLAWELTRDEELRRFLLDELGHRLTEEQMGTAGVFRANDYNAAAYAYYLSGDRSWLDRVARPFRVSFRAVSWPFAWIKAMYFIKLAFDHGLVRDEDVTVC